MGRLRSALATAEANRRRQHFVPETSKKDVGRVSPLSHLLDLVLDDTNPRFVHRELQISDIDLSAQLCGTGQAGSSVVRARLDEREVAVKFVPDLLQRREFLREITTLTIVKHPNIVALYGACTDENSPRGMFMVLEYADGGTVYDLIRDGGGQPLPPALALQYAFETMSAVEYCGRLEILHRDLKCLNLLLHEGSVKVCDFGASRDYKDQRGMVMTTFQNVGSFLWLAPETLVAEPVWSQASDVYAFGCVLYEMLVGRVPFGLDELADIEVPDAVKRGVRPTVPADLPDDPVSVALRALMRDCWLPDPRSRPKPRALLASLASLRADTQAPLPTRTLAVELAPDELGRAQRHPNNNAFQAFFRRIFDGQH